MTAGYHITGIIQASLFVLSISAAYVQLKFVRSRRSLAAESGAGEPATDNLSTAAIGGSFAAFFSFLLLSTATEPFAHYIFWSRIPACVLAILLLWEFRRDHPSSARALLGPIAAGLFIAALVSTTLAPEWSRPYIEQLQLFVIGAGIILICGQAHQLWLLLKEQRVGALSLRARTLNLLKDLSTVAFGLVLGIHQSWSLVVVAGANAAMTAIVIATGMRISNKGASPAQER